MTIDFYWRLSWQDPRWNVPFLWGNVNPELLSQGLDITPLVTNENNPLSVWLPDIAFFKSLDVEQVVQTIVLYEGGNFFWSRHVKVTYAQPQMYFAKYPLDVQNFSFVVQSYAFDATLLQLALYDDAVLFQADGQQHGELYINENQLWNYEAFTAYTLDEIVPNPADANNPWHFSTLYINLRFARQDLGIVYRLALPVTILLLIVGFSFWADLESRVDTTMNVLLVVGALYIVIGQVIPFVGYLSSMDIFVTSVFALLSFTVGVNFMVLLLNRKVKEYPLNIFKRDFVEYLFKALWIPMVIFIYIDIFDIQMQLIRILLYLAALITLVNAVLKIQYLRRSLKSSILLLRAKEQKVIAAKERITKSKQKHHNAPDSDDEYEEELEKMKAEYREEEKQPMDMEEEEKELMASRKAKRFRLLFMERMVLHYTRKWYTNDFEGLASVFGVNKVVTMSTSVFGGALNMLPGMSNSSSPSSRSPSVVNGENPIHRNTGDVELQ